MIKSGSRRFIIIFGTKVIKIPKFNCWVSFIQGVLENLHERYWWSSDGSRTRNNIWIHDELAEIYWADRFGLFLVMERCDVPVVDEIQKFIHKHPNFINEFELLKSKTNEMMYVDDCKYENVGYNKDGRLVYVDYGFNGGLMDCYIGT